MNRCRNISTNALTDSLGALRLRARFSESGEKSTKTIKKITNMRVQKSFEGFLQYPSGSEIAKLCSAPPKQSENSTQFKSDVPHNVSRKRVKALALEIWNTVPVVE